MSRADIRLTQEAVQADRAATSSENLCLALVELLKRARQEVWNPARRGHATKQVQSPRDKYIEHECEDIVFEWADQQDNLSCYNEPAVLKHTHIEKQIVKRFQKRTWNEIPQNLQKIIELVKTYFSQTLNMSK